jgi:signal transduction histidine kinase
LVHDLKNPINIIESGARSLLDKQDRYGPLTSRQEKVVRRLLRNALKIKTLTSCMLEVDMASQGTLKIGDCTLAGILRNAVVEVFDLVDPLVAEAIEETTDPAGLREALKLGDVFLEGEDSVLTQLIRTDETKLSMVITNLLSNALKYKEKNIFLRCSVDGDSINVTVKDDGPGIPECYHSQVFDQYFQCVTVEGFPVRGHGLGLAGAQALTEALGGKLSLGESAGGAEFIVRVECDRKS